MRFHAVTLDEACAIVYAWIGSTDSACRVVVTPNVDHLVMMSRNPRLRAAYEAASLIVADGWPIVAVSRLLRTPLPERVAGSDLVPSLMAQWQRPRRLRVFLLGAAPGVAEQAAMNIKGRWPFVDVCGLYSPPIGFERDVSENERIIEQVNSLGPDLVVVGLGAPKQEIWLHQHARQLSAKVAIAAGGTIDFIAGRQTRAPVWVRRIGMEWLHRLVSDPRRLAGRYLHDAWVFPQLVAKECWQKWTAKSRHP
jgi:N-acetylglucosaminyldiphosphoundecaprenol N-acetyl-beta-D-mannosaminyltransferase